ncbi:glycosyltransferase [Chromobacterium sp. IIBBL 290-4]|uniref:glycosyltransferase n=1 Tax=Chromobacterium sp. IIBBL 290-4 TaxID=2953890 RepID=UPI0020B820C4|nr:glycosyltransferase [Chromobacterium sp. IIBBL 290-4]UTH76557.1 glycosyltransferase [Chromobacterium sp. IIBBL 290-4]
MIIFLSKIIKGFDLMGFGDLDVKVSASLVIFNNSPSQIERLLRSVEQSRLPIDLVVVDNSPSNCLASYFSNHTYRHFGNNIGFGAAHNQVIRTVCSDYHVIINPDVEFAAETVFNLIQPMVSDNGVVACVPLVRYPDGRLQRLNKLLPTPMNLFFRRFFPFLAKRLDFHYEMQWFKYDSEMPLPNASGCFLAARTALLKELDGFDERFFMYLEDTDLTRRLNRHGVVLFNPKAVITHEFGRSSYKFGKLFFIHIQSAIRYFNKWGWLFDFERRRINKSYFKRKID